MANEFENLTDNEYVFVNFKLQNNAVTVLEYKRVIVTATSKNERGAIIGTFKDGDIQRTVAFNTYQWLASDSITGGLFKDEKRAIDLFNRLLTTRAVWYIKSTI